MKRNMVLIYQAKREGLIMDDVVITKDTIDGCYTFRMLYNAALFNEWARSGCYDVHKSLLHGDGSKIFDGKWFIVVAELPKGQISNHYALEFWDLFKIPWHIRANPYDGHTSNDVENRLKDLILNHFISENHEKLCQTCSGQQWNTVLGRFISIRETENLVCKTCGYDYLNRIFT